MRIARCVTSLIGGLAAIIISVPHLAQSQEADARALSHLNSANNEITLSPTPSSAIADPLAPTPESQVYGRLPLFFIRNDGQLDKRIKYYERGQGHSTLFTSTGPILNLAQGLEADKPNERRTLPATRSIPMSFRNANPKVEITAGRLSPTKVNLFYGNDPEQWRTGISTYFEVDYSNLYAGIDARFYGKGGALEYDMVVAPGTHPDSIEIHYENIKNLRIAADGDLIIDLGDGALRQTAPVVYQEIDGKRIEVDASFRLIKTAGESFDFGFTVAAYDTSLPLIIDPTIVYSSYLGGGLEDIGHDITADDEEQAFIVGETTSTDLLPVANFNAGTDVFLVQLNRQGNSLLTATYIGGSGLDRAYSVVRNTATGSVIVSGETQSTDFPIVNGFQTTLGGTFDVFVLDFDPVGNTLLYSTYMGGSGIDVGWDVGDNGEAGVIYIAGETRSMDFPVTLSTAFQTSYGGSNNDGFFAKIDTNLSGATSLVYSSYLGSGGNDAAYSIDVDAAGYVLVAGMTRQQFTTTANAYQTAFGGQQFDGFIAKFDLNQSGTAGMLYSSFFGGNNNDQIWAIRVDGTNNNIVYLAGDTASTIFPLTASAFDNTLGGTLDAFVAKLDLSLGASGLLYSSYLGGDGTDSATGVDANTAGNIYVSGVTNAPSVTTFPTTADGFQTAFGGGVSDGFFSVIDTTQSGAGSLLYSTLIGGNGDDVVNGMFITQTYGQAYITGSTTSSLGFPISTSPYTPYQSTIQGGTDAFVMRLAFIDNTPSGVGVVAPFVGDPAGAVIGGDITFNGTVSGGGSTWIVDSNNGPQEQPGFKFGSPPVYYYLESTVNYNGTIEICFDYNETKFSTEQSLKLQYWNGSGWDNITVSLDTVNNRICGSAGFSTEPFVISEPDPNAIPVMTYSAESGYGGTDGVDPDTGLTTDTYNYKVVYANDADLAPNTIDVCIDGFCHSMIVDSSASASLHDGIYSNGEQYIYTTSLAAGTHDYYFVGVNDAASTPLPATGSLSGPVVTQALQINTASLPAVIVGSSYSEPLSLSGGTGPYTWSIISGSLPTGLTLNSSTGEISGTPTVTGTSNFTVQVADALLATTTQILSITVNAPVTIDSITLSDATQGASYSQTLTASGGAGPYTWSISTGSLPAGLTLNSSSGEISGTPTGTGTSNFTVQVTDANLDTATQSQSITVNATLTIDPITLSDGTQGTGYSQTLTVTGGTGPYTWSISTGSLPAGLTLNATTGEISGTPTGSGTANFTVQVTDANLATTTQSQSITVNTPLTIDSITLNDATQGASYSQTLTASGGAGPYTWSISTGSLPAGLTLNSSTGEISGTPTTSGTANFTVQVTDANLLTDTQVQSITVNVAPTIDPITLSDATQGVSYSQTLTVSGGTGPYTWSISSGSLPAGLTLNATTGEISGTPTGSGTSNFTIQVTDANLAVTTLGQSLTVNAPLTVDSMTLSDATQGAGYSQTLTASGGAGPYTWSISSGSLPAGLTLNSSSGEISGTPTGTGTSNFTVQVTDANLDTATQSQSITVNVAPTIDPITLSDATQGVSYSQTLTVTGGTGPYTWSISSGSLPAGLTLNATTGEISGTPTGSGTANFTVQVTDANLATTTQSQSITVNTPLTIDSITLNDATQGASYSQTLTASGGAGPYTWSISSGSLPAGLTLNSSTGEISGTPTTNGTANFTVQVTDANLLTDTQVQSITVNVVPTIDPITLSDATQGTSYSQTLTVTGGTGPYTWTIISGSLPAGLTLNASTGEISGTPTATGTSNFTIQVADANMSISSQVFSLTVGSAIGCTPTPMGSNVTINPQADVTMTYTSVTAAGDTCVTRDIPKRALIDGYTFRGGQLPTYEITTMSTYAGSVLVCISFNQNDFIRPQTIRLFHDNGTNWDDISTNLDLTNDVVCGVTSSFSPFAIGEEEPTAITLSGFQAQKINGQLVINWTTQSEVDNWGFRLLRSETASGPYVPLSQNMIPARGGVGLTMSYSFVDTSADINKTYFYQLEDVNTRGLVMLHDAVAVQDLSSPVPEVARSAKKAATASGDKKVVSSSAGAINAALQDPGVTVLFPETVASTTDTDADTAQLSADAGSQPESAVQQLDGQPLAVAVNRSPQVPSVSPYDLQSSPPSPADILSDQDAYTPSMAFSVSIKDAQGHLITVSRGVVPDADTDIRPTDITVLRENDRTEVSWQVANKQVRGFVLHRRKIGETEYRTVVNYLPNYGDNDTAIYNYKFIDNDNNDGRTYQYRLEVLNWGIQTARRQ